MKNTSIKLTNVSIEEMLNDKENSAYNVSTWVQAVKSYAKFEKCQFYIQPKDECFTYNRFYVSYVADGIYFFSRWNAFSAGLSSNGFVRAILLNGSVYRNGFGEDGSKSIVNNKEGRNWIRKNLSSVGIMVSNCI